MTTCKLQTTSDKPRSGSTERSGAVESAVMTVEDRVLAIVRAQAPANYIDAQGNVRCARWMSIRDLATAMDMTREDLVCTIAVGDQLARYRRAAQDACDTIIAIAEN